MYRTGAPSTVPVLVWNAFCNAPYRQEQPLLCVTCLTACRTGSRPPAQKHPEALGIAAVQSWPNLGDLVKFLKSTQEENSGACLSLWCDCTCPCTVEHAQKYWICLPLGCERSSSAEKWYGRMLNHLLEQLHNALAHCELSCFWYRLHAGFVCQLCCLVGRWAEKGLEIWGCDWQGETLIRSLAWDRSLLLFS